MMRGFMAPGLDLAPEELELSAELTRHLGPVLRMAAGDQVVLRDGQGGAARCLLLQLDRKGGRARVLERWREQDTAAVVHLLQGLPKADKFDYVLQKATELGVTRVTPVMTSRTVQHLKAERQERRLERWQRVVLEASRQCGRTLLPEVTPPQDLATALAATAAPLKLLLWEEAQRPLREALPSVWPGAAAVLVGPEGGLTAEEAAVAQRSGFIPVRCGPRILRTETAGVAILTVLEYLYGDFGTGPTPGS